MIDSLTAKIRKVSASLFEWDTAIVITASGLAAIASMGLGKIIGENTDIYSVGVLGAIAAVSAGSLAEAGLRKGFNRSSFGQSLDHFLGTSAPLTLSGYGILPAVQHPDFPVVLHHLKNTF